MANVGRFLGIDYGAKRIGVAVSNESNSLAFPKGIILNDVNTFEKLAKIIGEGNISEIAVGDSLDFAGRPNAISSRIDIFVSDLEKQFGLPVRRQKEFLTSVEARRKKGGKDSLYQLQAHTKVKKVREGRVDASAAALILQRYIDRRNFLNC